VSLNEGKPVFLWGPVSAADLVAMSNTNELPELDHGDWLFFRNMGAYSLMMWMPFNGFPKPKIHYFIEESRRYVCSE
jgi:ornithine decarboxylase